MLPVSPLSFHSFASESLACLVTVKVLARGNKEDAVFVCLDKDFARSLYSSSFNILGASFVALEFQASDFRLSLASLESYANFLALELVPFLNSLYVPEPNLMLVGQQFSGVLGVYAAARFPTHFSGALCVSGSFWWKPEREPDWEWLSKWLAEQAVCPGKIFLICSSGAALDRPRGVPTTLMANRHLKDVLTAKSCQVQLLESLKTEFSSDFLAEFAQAVSWFVEDSAH